MENPNYDKIIARLEDELNLLKRQTSNVLSLTEKAMALCKNEIQEIREYILKNGFKTKEDE